MELQNRTALITGSGRGIGRAIAQLFAKEGAAVFLTARTEKELAAATNEISSSGGRAAYGTADLSQEADCARVVTAAREKFGRIDILVNNACHLPGPVTETQMSKELGAVLAKKLGVSAEEQLAGFLNGICRDVARRQKRSRAPHCFYARINPAP